MAISRSYNPASSSALMMSRDPTPPRFYPTDTKLLQRAELVARFADRLRQERRNGKSMAEARAAIEALVPAFLAAQWHRRLAESMEAERGTRATFDDIPAGLHWLRAGDAVRAELAISPYQRS